MKIALMGSRGIPASYGGFETLTEELGARLAAKGHDVTAYCRVPHVEYDGNTYRGIRLIKFPTVRRKHLDTIVHTAMSAGHALTQNYDLVLMFIAGNSPLSWVPRLAGQRVILHVDGLDWRRAKWGGLAQRYIRWCEGLAPILPNAFITDSTVVADYYRDRLGHAPDAVIGYGGDPAYVPAGETLARFGLEAQRYLLFVGRLVPENCVHHLVEACGELNHGFRCVIVGDAPYQESYISHLKRIAGPNTIFTGYVFGRGYRELSSNAFLFVEPSEVGGAHPAIVESMAMGNCVIVNGIPENRETVGDGGIFYDGSRGSAALRPILERLIDAPQEVERFRTLARQRAEESFRWDRIVDRYEALFEQILEKKADPDRLRTDHPRTGALKPAPRPVAADPLWEVPTPRTAIASQMRARN
jgi:glycosyltransferase involved in cell wall biosynthesis